MLNNIILFANLKNYLYIHYNKNNIYIKIVYYFHKQYTIQYNIIM